MLPWTTVTVGRFLARGAQAPGAQCHWALCSAATRSYLLKAVCLPLTPYPAGNPPLRVPNAAPVLAWQDGFPELGGSSERLGSVLNSQSQGIGEGKLGQLWQLEFTQLHTLLLGYSCQLWLAFG